MHALIRTAIVAASALLSGVAFAGGVPLFKAYVKPADEAKVLNAGDRAALVSLKTTRTNYRDVVAVSVDADAMGSNVISVTLPSGEAIEFTKDAGEAKTKLGMTTWIGTAKTGASLDIVAKDGEVLRGGITTTTGQFAIHRIGKGRLALARVDQSMERHLENDAIVAPVSPEKAASK